MNLNIIGQKCKEYRQNIGLLQTDVAKDTGYSIENISKFENGNNNNMKIFLWYLRKGLIIDYGKS